MINVVTFLLSSYIVYHAYDIVDRYLVLLPFYEESTRKLYIQKNIVKALYLSILVPIATIYFIFYKWDNTTLQMIASCYVSNDIIGLVRCELPKSTKIHHIATSIFFITTFMIDFTTSKVGELLVYYTYFASLAFPVNMYLGLRLCYERPHPQWLLDCKIYCGYWYLFTCILNWVLQLHLISTLDITVGIYTLVMIFIVFDDVILLKFLLQERIKDLMNA